MSGKNTKGERREEQTELVADTQSWHFGVLLDILLLGQSYTSPAILPTSAWLEGSTHPGNYLVLPYLDIRLLM